MASVWKLKSAFTVAFYGNKRIFIPVTVFINTFALTKSE